MPGLEELSAQQELAELDAMLLLQEVAQKKGELSCITNAL